MELEILERKAAEGAHILITAQRRMGKTSLLRELAERLKHRCICLFVDFEHASSAADAVVEISLALNPYKPLWQKTRELFRNILDLVDKVSIGELGLTLRAGLTTGDWKDKGNCLFGILASSETPVILMMDEVPILVNRILKGDDFTITPERRRDADIFMSWLRDNGQRYRGRVAMMISGSIGLEPVVNQAGLSATLNIFDPVELKPWDNSTAISCLQALANEYGIEFIDSAAEAIVSRLGYCIPHHVQMFFSNIHDRCLRKGVKEFHPEEVEEVYETEMLGIHGHVELTHYEERLKQVLPIESYALALEMLTETAVSGSLSLESLSALAKFYEMTFNGVFETQKTILQVLEHDGYLKQSPDGYLFVSPLLRDWWRKRHGFFHTPVLKRSNHAQAAR
jgi:energy-coupling factor transporter ATP-binding protein EcfA2